MRLLLCLLMAAAGCSKSSELVTKLEGFKTEICACKDAACAIKADLAASTYLREIVISG